MGSTIAPCVRLSWDFTPEAAQQVLIERFQLARSPEIHLGPDWLPFVVPVDLPALPWRIRVNVDWDGAAELARS